MKTMLIEVHRVGDKETKDATEYLTKYEAERFKELINGLFYDYVDDKGIKQVHYAYTVPKKRYKA